jgi:hypothetical protein
VRLGRFLALRAARALRSGPVSRAAILVACLLRRRSWSPPSSSAQTSERITRYDSDLTIEADGGLLVREAINYDFGSTPRHGIIREIPVRVDYPPKENTDRYPIDVLSVTASDGASAQYEVSEDGDNLSIRIGDPDSTITGAHTYEITYRVPAPTTFADHDELWNVIGTGGRCRSNRPPP